MMFRHVASAIACAEPPSSCAPPIYELNKAITPMTSGTKVANFAHRVTVTGLASLTLYYVINIGIAVNQQRCLKKERRLQEAAEARRV